MTEDEDVADAVRDGLKASGIQVVEDARRIERFEQSEDGVRVVCSNGGPGDEDRCDCCRGRSRLDGAAGLNLDAVGVRLDERGYVQVDDQMRTSAGHIYAAGDVTGLSMVVQRGDVQAVVAATNAAAGGQRPPFPRR